ncbi:hypothetical protein QQX98_005860 [Neonectria punicea]|uniref:Transcription factor domain-containing protein n=1 Tax=Neonectria punicea TaxID=979145 RepID=A0ABR1H3E5_9HYPO
MLTNSPEKKPVWNQFMVHPTLRDSVMRKDRTLVEILDRLKNVEGKIDNLDYKSNTSNSSAFGTSQSTSVYPASTPLLAESDGQDGPRTSSAAPTSPTAVPHGGYHYDSSVSKMLEWPAIRQMFDSLEQKPHSPSTELYLSTLPKGLRDSSMSLSTDGIQSTDMSDNGAMQVHLQFPGSSNLNRNLPGIEWDTIQGLTKGYFDFFNFLYPLMDRQWFDSNILSSIINTGFQEGTNSTVALLVFALGEVALTASEAPTVAYKGRPSGIKGGTTSRPPGITYFNEARKHMGFALTEVSLENVQMFTLASLYYGTCGQAVECWRMTVSASLACQTLITRCLQMEFGLPLTGLEKLDDAIGFPDFSGPMTNEDYLGNQMAHFQEHFACQIILRRLSANFHQDLNNSFGENSSLPFPGFGTYSGSSGDKNMATVKQFATQLDQWRGMLPGHLRWQDDQLMAFPGLSRDAFGDVYPDQSLQNSHIFTSDLNAPQGNYPYAADIQVALLRTRYYYNKHLIYRPCVFKALHHPNSLTREDADGAAECLKASLKWPIALSPPRTNKRLVPVPFFWSQNLFGILVLLHLSHHHPMLQRIRSSLCGENFDKDAAETVNLYLDWLRDMKRIDSTADWCWTVIRTVYQLDE